LRRRRSTWWRRARRRRPTAADAEEAVEDIRSVYRLIPCKTMMLGTLRHPIGLT
jgi:hypothetical protein